MRIVVKFDTTYKYTNVSKNFIIRMGREPSLMGAHAVCGLFNNVCSPIHKYQAHALPVTMCLVTSETILTDHGRVDQDRGQK